MSQNILMQKQLFAVLTLCAAPLAGCSASDGSTTEGASTGEATTGDDGGATAQVTTQTPTTGTGESTESPTTAASVTNATTGDATTGEVTTGDEESTGHVSRGESTTDAPPVESCEDGLVNQDETDVDCGGAVCGPCADGLLCTADEDCVVASCILGTCAAPSCEDGLQNADETDADCGGGTCGACQDNLACVAPEDCMSGVCTEGVCTPPSCADGLQNGDETDLDCGGAICDGCGGALACNSGDDCLSETCTDGLCEQVECLVDADCAALDTDCSSGSCKMPGYTCEAVPINDGQACGGDLCFTGTTCVEGLCGGGAPVDCSGESDQCHVGTCDPGTGTCGAMPLPDGTKCEDGVACTKLEVCKVGACGGSTDPLLVEAFADNNAGWTLGTEWAIGATAVSVGCNGGQDPAADHTPTDDNGVAGVVLGGCSAQVAHDYYCLTSPVVDLSKAAADVHLSYWRWLHSDYTPYMKNKIEVFNGVTWVSVFETFAASTHDAAWTFFTYDVTLHKNDKFQARWCFNTGGGVYAEGSWSVDDVTLGANACMQ